MRAQTELTVLSIDQCSYAEYLTTLADPTAFYALSLAPSEAPGALDINPLVAFAIVDRMMGGGGTGAAPNRGLTDIELNVVDSMVRVLLDGLTETWKPIAGVTFAIKGRETRSQMLPSSPDDAMVVVHRHAHRRGQGTAQRLPAGRWSRRQQDSAQAAAATRRDRANASGCSSISPRGRAVSPISKRGCRAATCWLETGDVLSPGVPGRPVTVQVGGGKAARLSRVTARAVQVVGSPAAGPTTGEMTCPRTWKVNR